jgi:hypothetical protein
MAWQTVPPLWLSGAGVYLAVHFGLYTGVLRHHSVFSRERTIFLYHLVSAVVSAGVLTAWLLIQHAPDTPAILVGVCCLHGIYSMSFLELWSLAEGGYSLQILSFVANRKASCDLSRTLRGIGEGKRSARLDALIGLGLIDCRAGHLELTGWGRVVSKFLGSIAWLTGLREGG